MSIGLDVNRCGACAVTGDMVMADRQLQGANSLTPSMIGNQQGGVLS